MSRGSNNAFELQQAKKSKKSKNCPSLFFIHCGNCCFPFESTADGADLQASKRFTSSNF